MKSRDSETSLCIQCMLHDQGKVCTGAVPYLTWNFVMATTGRTCIVNTVTSDDLWVPGS